jgi:hypothetical protein
MQKIVKCVTNPKNPLCGAATTPNYNIPAKSYWIGIDVEFDTPNGYNSKAKKILLREGPFPLSLGLYVDHNREEIGWLGEKEFYPIQQQFHMYRDQSVNEVDLDPVGTCQEACCVGDAAASAEAQAAPCASAAGSASQ